MSEKSSRLKAIIGGSIGNLVEWYDWYAYSAFALYFSGAFFPDANPTAKLLQTAGVFALGFLMRPVGGWVFGRIADKHGRKKAMTLSVLLMSFGSLLIALVPNYAAIGVAAPIILTLARLLQGLSVGGEYGVSATYLSEMATSKSRGFYSSFQYVTLVGGQLVALGVQLLLQAFILTEAQLYSWGWRIPFVIGAILAFVALYLRKSLHETEAFENTLPIANGTHPHSHSHPPSVSPSVPHSVSPSVSPSVSDKRGTIRELLKHPKAILTVVGLTLGGTLAFYTFTTYMQKFLVNTAHFSVAQSTSITAVSLLIFIFLQPLFGALSDRIGRKPLLIGFGILGTLCTIPLLTALGNTHTQGMATFLLLLGLIVVSGYTSINAVVKAELFPAEIRALGVGLPYALTVALFGGTAEYIALWFKSMGHESWFYYYITGCVFFSLIVYAFMKETKKNSKIG